MGQDAASDVAPGDATSPTSISIRNLSIVEFGLFDNRILNWVFYLKREEHAHIYSRISEVSKTTNTSSSELGNDSVQVGKRLKVPQRG